MLGFNLLLFSAEETSNKVYSESNVEVTLTGDVASVASCVAGKLGALIVRVVV